jgi:tetratricopeptide (TPR) repeat protein
MRIGERPQTWAALLLVVAVSATLALLFRQAMRDDESSFFVSERPAEWIVYPNAPEPVRPKGELEAIFTRRFSLERAPERARLALRLHRTGSVAINGAPVPFAALHGVAWKEKRDGDVAALLRAGENTLEVRVVARSGPPAVWLALEGDGFQVVTDAAWTASLMGAEEAPARPARTPLAEWPRAEPDPELLAIENPRPIDALRSRAGEVVALLGLGGALALAVAFALRRQGLSQLPARWTIGAWLVGGAAWLVLFLHNQGLHGAWGFDAGSHQIYIRTVLQQGRLPLADEGWQMYQPPLYYLLAAGWLKLGGFTTTVQNAVDWLRWLGLAAGVLQALFVLLALRELFPDRPGLVLCGFVFGGCLPVSLYLYQFVTNEILVAMLSSGAVWWTIRMLRRPESGLRDHAILGVLLGLAMLAKFSALIPLTVCSGVLLGRRWLAEPRRLGRHLARLALTFACVFAVCGWHYVRVALRFDGNPFVGNWDDVSGQAWWQDPGYHVREDYTRFGLALERPLMSAVAGVPDAVYSTLWGDGMISGVGRVHTPPPWDRELMAAGYALALGPTLAVLLGVLIGFVDFVRRPRAERFLALSVLGATFYAFVNMTLRLPYYAQAKAFYGLSALVPLAFCFALGFDALVLRWRALAPLGLAWLAGWAMVAYLSFFGDPQRLRMDPMSMELAVDEGRWIETAQEQIRKGDRAAAIESLRRALERDPDRGGVAQLLAQQLVQEGRRDEALAAVRTGLRGSPAGQMLHLMAGELWLERGEAERAAFHFDAAARLLPSSAVGFIDDARRRQAEALRAAGRWSEAIALLRDLRTRGGLPASSARLLAELLLEAPAELRDPALALEVAESTERAMQHLDPSVLDALAAAQAATGRAADAVRTQERALAIWRDRRDATHAARAEARLADYRRAAGTRAAGDGV